MENSKIWSKAPSWANFCVVLVEGTKVWFSHDPSKIYNDDPLADKNNIENIPGKFLIDPADGCRVFVKPKTEEVLKLEKEIENLRKKYSDLEKRYDDLDRDYSKARFRSSPGC